MDKQYKIIQVSPKIDDWSTAHGNFKTYHTKLDGFDGVVQVNQKDTTPAPEVDWDEEVKYG